MSFESFIIIFCSLLLGTLAQMWIGWPVAVFFWLAASCGFIVWMCEGDEYE